jgi:hypothetical protein
VEALVQVLETVVGGLGSQACSAYRQPQDESQMTRSAPQARRVCSSNPFDGREFGKMLCRIAAPGDRLFELAMPPTALPSAARIRSAPSSRTWRPTPANPLPLGGFFSRHAVGRHWVASQAVTGGHSIKAVQAQLGHRSEQSTHMYAHLGSGAQRRLVEALAPLAPPHVNHASTSKKKGT